MRARESRVFGNHKLDAAAATRLLAPAEEQQLARAAVSGDALAFERLVVTHLRLVFSIAYAYRRHQLPLDELVSEGLIGLVTACRRFDPERGTRLAPYAARTRSAARTARASESSRSGRTARNGEGRPVRHYLRDTCDSRLVQAHQLDETDAVPRRGRFHVRCIDRYARQLRRPTTAMFALRIPHRHRTQLLRVALGTRTTFTA